MPSKTVSEYLIFLVIVISIVGCKSIEAQQNCLKAYVKVISTNPEYHSIRQAALDTAIQWSRKNLRQFSGFKQEIWQIDSAVFFNEDRSKALLLLLQIKKKHDVTFDNVKMLAAEKKDGSWYFYAQPLPTIGFDRNLNPNSRPYTFEELSETARKELIIGGYYKKQSCTINYDYVNGWFKEPLAEYHLEFLNKELGE